MKTKVLILHTSVGYGIKITAEAILERLQKAGDFDLRIEDVEKVESGAGASLVRKTYLAILDHVSGLWGFLYNSRIILSLSLPLRKFFASFKSGHILKILREFQPAVVISTQTVPSGIIAYLKSKGLYRGKLVIVFSDYHLHEFWLYKEADLYVCNIEEQVSQLKQLGIPKEKIVLTGTMVFEKFFKPVSREEACLAFGLLTSMPTVLIFSGGRARHAVREMFLQLLRSPKTFQIAVVCGNNPELKEELQAISAPSRHPVKVLGYVNNMEVLMSACNVMVGKTGGPTMAEAVIKKLPMVLTDVRPGHELINLEYLLRWGIVQHGRIPREVAYLVEQFLDGRLANNSEKSLQKIVSPPGSVSVVDAVRKIIPQPAAAKVTYYESNP